MRKYIYCFALLFSVMALFTGCSEDNGTEPGGDSTPVATLFQEDVTKGMSVDNDMLVRVATNSATESVYYIASDSATYKKDFATMGVDGYNNYVVEKGTKVEDLGANGVKDVAIKGMEGDYVVTFVAVKGNVKHASSLPFLGLVWSKVASGQYYFQPQDDGSFGLEDATGLSQKSGVELQKCENVADTYRFKNLYGEGNSLKFTVVGGPFTSQSGNKYYQLQVDQQLTGFSNAKLGNIFVQDIASWQNNNAYQAYNRYFPELGVVELYLEYGVSAGYISYGYDEFEAE